MREPEPTTVISPTDIPPTEGHPLVTAASPQRSTPESVSGTITLAVLDIARAEIAKATNVEEKVRLMREFTKASNRVNRLQLVITVMGFLTVSVVSAAAVICAFLSYGALSWIFLLMASGGGAAAYLRRARRTRPPLGGL